MGQPLAVPPAQNEAKLLIEASLIRSHLRCHPSQARFNSTEPNLLEIFSALATSQLTVKATLNGVTGTALIEVPLDD